MIASARWAYAAASRRTESRGMHRRRDFPEADPALRQRLVISGTDQIVVESVPIADPVTPYEDELIAAAA